MHQLAGAVARSMAGFSDPNRPEMTAMFLGPTGVGKTLSAKALAQHLYRKDWQDHFLRIDCTQLQESHSVGRLKGSEPSYVGYGDNNILITPDFLQKGGVIVFDEIEKAHPNIIRWLLPVMEEGQQKALIPKRGGTSYSSELTTLDFSKTYIIMTANVGAEALHKARTGNQGIGFHSESSKPDMEKIGTSELKKAFKDMPEFLGRIDSTVVFKDLGRPELERVFNKFLDEINQDQRRGMNFLAVTSELRDFVLDHAETGEYGAREIRHKIDTYILDKASEIKVSGVLPEMAPLIGDLEGNEVIFWTTDIIEKPIVPEIKKIEEPITLSPEQIDTLEYLNGSEKIDKKLPIQSQRDPGSNIGNQPDKPRKVFKPSGPREEYSVTMTFEDGTTETVDGLDQHISNLLLYGLGEDPTWNGKRVKSAHSTQEEKKPKPLSFIIPADGVIFDSMDLAITIRAGGQEYQQLMEGLPILKTK